ncbi:MAG: hypothetical protein AB1750_17080, partial [Chloroflexota bacterium]
AEIVARSSLGDLLPAPSVEADSFLFDAKVYDLEQQVRRDGGADCVFIGSSVTNNSVDPAIVERAYNEQTGETIHCFNFAYPAMNAENAATFADAVIAKFRPRLIVYTFIPRDLTDTEYTVDFLEASPWFQTDNPRAWLVNRSYAYRYYLTWRYWLVNANRAKRLEEIQNLTDKGFQPTFDIRDPYPARINMTEDYLATVWSDPRTQRALENLLARQTEEVRIILVEGAIHNDGQSASLFAAYERDYIAPLEKILAARNVPYWRTNEIAATIPKEHWYDWFHVNNPGAQTFSEWLGHMLAENQWLFEK